MLGACAAPRPIAQREDSVMMRLSQAPPRTARTGRLAEQYFTDGSLLSMRERHGEAIESYRRALELDSTNGAIYYAIGRSYRELNEIDSALRYSQLAAEHGDYLAVYEQLADLHMLTGDIDGAIAQYDSMLTRDASHLQSRYMVARLLERRDPERAIVHFEYILNNLVEDADVMLRLAELYLDKGTVDKAVDMMYRMLALEPASAELHLMATVILIDARRYDAATGLLRGIDAKVPSGAALEGYYLDIIRDIDDRLSGAGAPDDSLLSFARELVIRASANARTSLVRVHAGSVALSLGDDARAEALFARALEDTAATVHTLLRTLAGYVDAGEPATGLRIALPHVERFADDYRVAHQVGTLYADDGQLDSAVSWLRRSLSIYGENADAWGSLARLYDRMDRLGECKNAYEQAIAIETANAVLLREFALALAQRHTQLDLALELAERAVAIEPENESLLDARGWVRFRRGELDAAVGDLERATSSGGADASVYEHLGDVRAARGETDRAREAYERAQRIDPERPGLDAKIDGMR